VALLGLLGAAAPAGFLLYNWAPAKVFMGDVGSAFLGFLFAALPAVAGQARLELWVCAVLLLWPFLFDTALTLTQRIYRRENILAAHRSHVYQRLTASGLSHARVAVLYTVLAFTGVIAAVVVVSDKPGAPVIAVVIVGCSALSLWRYVSTRSRNP
jgi:UDP-N-acetylmuramyl pentapeptide phosphotransferase/UDP-N-acetylglucosamine-1-phosphate transferase